MNRQDIKKMAKKLFDFFAHGFTIVVLGRVVLFPKNEETDWGHLFYLIIGYTAINMFFWLRDYFGKKKRLHTNA